jgi:hypothetical protein
VGLTGDLTFSKNECPATGAIFSSQNAVKTAKLFSFMVFLIYTRQLNDLLKAKAPPLG